MVVFLERIFWSATASSIITAFLIFLWLRKERYLRTLKVFGSAMIIGWLGYFVQRQKVLNTAEPYFKPIELLSYYGQSECFLEIKEDFSYSITKNSEAIKTGDWNVYKGDPPLLTLDDQIFGINELKVK